MTLRVVEIYNDFDGKGKIFKEELEYCESQMQKQILLQTLL